MDQRISAEAAAAVATLFKAEASALFGYACTLPGTDRAEAEDLVQMTFQEAAAKWEQCLCSRDPESQRRWLYRVLRNKAVDQWRAYGSKVCPSERRLEGSCDPPREPYYAALVSISLQRVWEKIAMMPLTRQRVACLAWGEDWSSAEIAELLGISKSTVRVHLKHARDELAGAIGPHIPFTESGGDGDEGAAW